MAAGPGSGVVQLERFEEACDAWLCDHAKNALEADDGVPEIQQVAGGID